MILDLEKFRKLKNKYGEPLETSSYIVVIDDMVMLKLCGNVALFYGGMLDGSSFAEKKDADGNVDTLYFPRNLNLADMIREAVEWGLPF